MSDLTNPAEPEVEVVDDVELDDSSTEEAEADNPEEGEPEEAEPETVEVEIDGVKYNVPANLKDKFMLQADYTRKTQEVAATRKALEERITQAEQASEGEVNARAHLVALDAALSQYENVDWDALENQNPALAQKHFRTFYQLQQQRASAETVLQEAQQTRELETQRMVAERVEQGIAELQRDIPDWGPEKAEALMAFGEKQFGFDRDYMESITDPKLIKLMNAAYLALSPKSQPKPAAQTIKPASKVKGGEAPKKRLADDLSPEEWVKQRNAELARRK